MTNTIGKSEITEDWILRQMLKKEVEAGQINYYVKLTKNVTIRNN